MTEETESAIVQITSNEIESQITTARKYPRDIAQAVKRTTDLVCMDDDTAMACFYRLERKSRGGVSVIEGPSVRLAEIAVSQWGNLRAGARIIEESQRFVVAQGVFHDLESNVCITVEVRRSIWGRSGRYGSDMIQTTANAACAIAYRNAVFKGIPGAIIDKAYQAARLTAIGDASQLADRIKKMFTVFDAIGVDRNELLGFLGAESDESISSDDIARAIGVYNAIKNGDTNVESAIRGREDRTQEGAALGEADG